MGWMFYGGAMIILGKNVVVENSVLKIIMLNHSGGAIYVLSILMIVADILKKEKI